MPPGRAAPATSQTLIVNVYTLIAVVYCGASTLLFYQVVGDARLGLAHLVALTGVSANFLVLQATRDYRAATHGILAIGTFVVASLYATGGWVGTGPLWTFAYLPYAFFLASPPVARLWVGVLVLVDLALVGLAAAGAFALPYSPEAIAVFFAALGIFLLCMFLFQRAALASEDRERARSQELLAANHALETREQELAQTQEMARLGSWSWDPALDRTEWSDQTYGLFGVPRDGRPFTRDDFLARVHPDDRPVVLQALSLGLEGQPIDVEVRATRNDGEQRTLHIRGRSERDAAGALRRLHGAIQDVTEAREAEAARRRSAMQLQELESLKEINRLKTQFMNTAAHELSTPLTPITLELRLLRDQLSASPGSAKHSVEVLERNVDRMAMLVRDLLEGARLQSAQLALQRTRLDLGALAREAASALEAVARERGVALELEARDGLWVDADSRRLGQVLDNLIGNAIKFTPRGGRVRIQGLRASGGVSIRVEDTGAGLSAQDIPKLFQPFVQVHDTMQRTRSGSGLGLYISKGIVEAHGGRMGVESPGLGQGATFWFVLPVADMEATA